jgi:hypothetical protein
MLGKRQSNEGHGFNRAINLFGDTALAAEVRFSAAIFRAIEREDDKKSTSGTKALIHSILVRHG